MALVKVSLARVALPPKHALASEETRASSEIVAGAAIRALVTVVPVHAAAEESLLVGLGAFPAVPRPALAADALERARGVAALRMGSTVALAIRALVDVGITHCADPAVEAVALIRQGPLIRACSPMPAWPQHAVVKVGTPWGHSGVQRRLGICRYRDVSVVREAVTLPTVSAATGVTARIVDAVRAGIADSWVQNGAFVNVFLAVGPSVAVLAVTSVCVHTVQAVGAVETREAPAIVAAFHKLAGRLAVAICVAVIIDTGLFSISLFRLHIVDAHAIVSRDNTGCRTTIQVDFSITPINTLAISDGSKDISRMPPILAQQSVDDFDLRLSHDIIT